MLHQHGISRSQVPIGRSTRANRRYGLIIAGAHRSIQLPTGMSTAAIFVTSTIVGLIRDLPRVWQIIEPTCTTAHACF